MRRTPRSRHRVENKQFEKRIQRNGNIVHEDKQMKKQEFIDEIRMRMEGLPEEEVTKSIDYYSEMIDDRIEDGNLGEHRPCRSGVWKLKIDYGVGYRVYYSMVGSKIVLLLCAGTKRTQEIDIDKAVYQLKKYKEEYS